MVCLVEEIQSRGSLPAWRRDGDNGHKMRITKRGLQAIRTNDEATARRIAEEATRAARESVSTSI